MSILFGEFGNQLSSFDALKKEFSSIWPERNLQEQIKALHGVGVATSQAQGFFPETLPVWIPEQSRLYALSGYLWTDHGFPLDSESVILSIVQAGNRLINQEQLVLPDQWGGVFILVAFDQLKGAGWITSDPSGILPLYYTSLQNSLLFSSHIRPLAKVTQALIDPIGLVQSTAFHYTIGSRTNFKNISRLNAGETLKFERDNGQISISQTPGIYSGIERYKSTHEAAEALWSDYLAGVKQICQPPGIHGVLLSGGFDTRLVMIGYQLFDAPVTGFTLGDVDNYEVQIALRVAGMANASTTVYTPIDDCDPPAERIQRLINRVESANFAYCETGADVLKQQGACSISTGIGGETFLGGQAFSFLGEKWNQKARFSLGIRRSLGLPVKFYTPVNRINLEAAQQEIHDYSLKILKRSRKLFHPDWLPFVDQSIDSLPEDIHRELLRLLQNKPETVEQLFERFWWEHHVCKEFGRQELTSATILPMALPTLHHTFYKRCSSLEPSKKVDHGIYLQLVRNYFEKFSSIPTANIPIAINNPELLLWIARAIRARQDQSIVRRQLQSKGLSSARRYGWMNFEDWIRQTNFLRNLEGYLDWGIFNQREIFAKTQRIADWRERVFSSQELLTLITSSFMVADFHV